VEQPTRLAVSIDDDSVQIATVQADGRMGTPRTWPRRRFSTLTDALLTFERETQVPLKGMACAIGILGVTHGQTIMLARGGWAISQVGLRSLFQRDVVVINDVAARAWAVLGGQAGAPVALSSGAALPDFGRMGRWAVTNIDHGVGLAVIDVDQRGNSRVLECEMGHCAFAPAAAVEERLATGLDGSAVGGVSWEQILTVGLEGAAWRAEGLPAKRAERMALLARLAGRFASEIVFAHGAWNGVVLTGSRIGEIADEGHLPLFNTAFEHKNRFQRLIRAAPRWSLAGRDVALAGLAVALEHHPAVRAT
jgi:glucokinase